MIFSTMTFSNKVFSNTAVSCGAFSLTKFIPFRITFLLVSAMCLLLAAIPDTVEARGGGRVVGGGISRSSPAAGGSLSATSTPAIQRQPVARQDNQTAQPRTARNAGDIRPTRSAGSANGAQSADGAGQARAVGETRSVGQTRAVNIATTPTAAEMAAYRQQFKQQNQDREIDRDRDNWDKPVDPDYDVPVDRPVIPAIVVATTIRRANDNDIGYVNTVADPTYLTEDACSLKAMAAINDVTYYRCSDTWYKRGYQSGNVVYIPTDPPAGY